MGTDRQTDRDTGMSGCRDGQTDTGTDGCRDGQTDGQRDVGVWEDRQTDIIGTGGCRDGQTDIIGMDGHGDVQTA